MKTEQWVETQTNRALQSEHDVGRAYVEAMKAGVPFHNDRWKNWDNIIAVKHVLKDVKPADRILDAGACRDPKSPSAFLPGLSEHGYQRLIGCNLDEKHRVMERGIRYEPGDIMNTTYPDGFFGFVACLSVIEHGVNEFKFLQEMSRIIKRGGKLFVSFDYWYHPIDTGDRMAWGAPVRIFNADDVHAMVKYADGIGFQCANYTLSCGDAVINCFGLNYTFFNLLLECR